MRRLPVASHCILALAAAWTCAGTPELAGQGVGPAAPGSFEVGWLTQWIRRDLTDEFGRSGTRKWGRGALFLKFAPNRRLALSLDGVVLYNGDYHGQFPGRRYRRTDVGATATGIILQRGQSQLGLSVGGHHVLDFDESSAHYHKRYRRIFGALVLSHGFRLAGQGASAWVAPAYVHDEIRQFPGSEPAYTFSSEKNVALMLGGEVLLARHLRPYAQATFATRWGTELGWAYRF